MLAFTEWTDLEMDFTSYYSSSYGDFPGTDLPRNRACALINCYTAQHEHLILNQSEIILPSESP